MVALEASACGLPLVMYDCPTGPAELLAHGGNGILVPDGDVDALAAALARLMGDPVERAAMGARARQVAADYAPAPVVRPVGGALHRDRHQPSGVRPVAVTVDTAAGPDRRERSPTSSDAVI